MSKLPRNLIDSLEPRKNQLKANNTYVSKSWFNLMGCGKTKSQNNNLPSGYIARKQGATYTIYNEEGEIVGGNYHNIDYPEAELGARKYHLIEHKGFIFPSDKILAWDRVIKSICYDNYDCNEKYYTSILDYHGPPKRIPNSIDRNEAINQLDDLEIPTFYLQLNMNAPKRRISFPIIETKNKIKNIISKMKITLDRNTSSFSRFLDETNETNEMDEIYEADISKEELAILVESRILGLFNIDHNSQVESKDWAEIKQAYPKIAEDIEKIDRDNPRKSIESIDSLSNSLSDNQLDNILSQHSVGVEESSVSQQLPSAIVTRDRK